MASLALSSLQQLRATIDSNDSVVELFVEMTTIEELVGTLVAYYGYEYILVFVLRPPCARAIQAYKISDLSLLTPTRTHALDPEWSDSCPLWCAEAIVDRFCQMHEWLDEATCNAVRETLLALHHHQFMGPRPSLRARPSFRALPRTLTDIGKKISSSAIFGQQGRADKGTRNTELNTRTSPL